MRGGKNELRCNEGPSASIPTAGAVERLSKAWICALSGATVPPTIRDCSSLVFSRGNGLSSVEDSELFAVLQARRREPINALLIFILDILDIGLFFYVYMYYDFKQK